MDNFLREQRKKLRGPDGRRVTQDRMAQRIGVSRGSVDAWERGDRTPPLKWAARIAAGYEVPVSRIERLILEMSRMTAAAGK